MRGGSGPSAACSACREGLHRAADRGLADGVGTKIKVAIEAGRHDTIGHCLVNHCVNDILVQGAVPLFFLDYVAFGKLDPAVVEGIVVPASPRAAARTGRVAGRRDGRDAGRLHAARLRPRGLHRRRTWRRPRCWAPSACARATC
jgi:hypothetical protein